jgi:hypothetical protein
MKARSEHEGGPSIIDGRARLAAVKTPHAVRPRRRRAGGLDGVDDELRTAAIDGRRRPWQQAVVPTLLRAHDSPRPVSGAPSIVVSIGYETRVFHAFVTAALVRHDAPSTITLYRSTLTDLAGFAADEVMLEPPAAASSARLVLVDAMELTWQRAQWCAAGHRSFPADERFVGLATLQRWLWQRLQAPDVSGDDLR